MDLSMSREEAEAFLAGPHVAVLSVAEAGRGPLSAPVWYSYLPGGPLRFQTGRESKKARLIRAAGRVTLCVQTETPPYKYLTVEGPATLGEIDRERDVRGIPLRYLGPEGIEAYLKMNEADRLENSVIVEVQIERWQSADFAKVSG